MKFNFWLLLNVSRKIKFELNFLFNFVILKNANLYLKIFNRKMFIFLDFWIILTYLLTKQFKSFL